MLRGFFDRQRRLLRPVIERGQRALVFVLLALTYFLVMGAARLFAELFQRRLVRRPRLPREGSLWLPAEGCRADRDSLGRQF